MPEDKSVIPYRTGTFKHSSVLPLRSTVEGALFLFSFATFPDEIIVLLGVSVRVNRLLPLGLVWVSLIVSFLIE